MDKLQLFNKIILVIRPEYFVGCHLLLFFVMLGRQQVWATKTPIVDVTFNLISLYGKE